MLLENVFTWVRQLCRIYQTRQKHFVMTWPSKYLLLGKRLNNNINGMGRTQFGLVDVVYPEAGQAEKLEAALQSRTWVMVVVYEVEVDVLVKVVDSDVVKENRKRWSGWYTLGTT